MGLKTIEIWMEGFAITGQRQGASKLGVYQANTFDEAVEMYKKENPKSKVHKYEDGGYGWWGCNFYDNEAEARKSFG